MRNIIVHLLVELAREKIMSNLQNKTTRTDYDKNKDILAQVKLVPIVHMQMNILYSISHNVYMLFLLVSCLDIFSKLTIVGLNHKKG